MLPGDCQPILCHCARDGMVLMRREKISEPPPGVMRQRGSVSAKDNLQKKKKKKGIVSANIFPNKGKKLISALSFCQSYSAMAEVELGVGTEAWNTLLWPITAAAGTD